MKLLFLFNDNFYEIELNEGETKQVKIKYKREYVDVSIKRVVKPATDEEQGKAIVRVTNNWSIFQEIKAIIKK